MTAINFNDFFTTYIAAARSKDVDAMVALYAEDIREFDMWGDWNRDGIATLRKAVESWFGGVAADETVQVSFSDITSQTGPDLAAAQAIVTFAATTPSGEILRSMQNRLSWVAAKRSEGWRIVHQHTSSPIDPETTAVIWHRAG